VPEPTESQVPETLEGWYVLHEVWTVQWARWRGRSTADRAAIAREAADWMGRTASGDGGGSAAYSVLTQKGDLMLVHYRANPDDLNRVELSLRQQRVHDFLEPTYSYLSVIEVSLYEAMALAMKRVADRGLARGSAEFRAAYDEELVRQKQHLNERLARPIPPHRYICFYPMNKRRGEQVNWYTLPLEERRAMMRSHGTIGHKYHTTVTQVISGSVGLDDWEWGVSLHAEDTLVFKKLVYEMRFDRVSALYAEFGPFYVGVRLEPLALEEYLLNGRLP
jgi:chlorite dismutase